MKKIKNSGREVNIIIIGLVCSTVCSVLSLYKKIMLLPALLFLIGSIIIWQIELFVLFKESRSDSTDSKSKIVWNIFYLFKNKGGNDVK